jgi:competence protein ComEC
VLAVDVGQGSAVLVRTQHHLMVYDTGPRYSRESDAGQRVLLPLLQARGETRIDRLVLSHRDADHVGGASALLKHLPVGDLLSSLEPGHPLLALAPRATRCDAGQSWQWDGVRFEVLHPAAADHGVVRKSNALSCVLRVSGAQGRMLLTGDLEREQELRLVAAQVQGVVAAQAQGVVAAHALLASDVLLVPHHGSRTSSSAPFLDAVAAQVAIVQAGYRNHFGHPVPEVMARLHARGAQVVQNTSCGAWLWDGSVPPTQALCERALRRRYWHHALPPE